jgi:predicted ribosome quality control (RQC) complex YloA/Tae2 family protein
MKSWQDGSIGMRDKLSSFDVACIANELSEMIGSRMRKAYQPHYEQVVLKLNRKGLPSTDLVIVRGKRLYTSYRDRPMPSKPSQFAMVIRKYLNNSRLVEVNQFGFDRVIELVFEKGSGKIKIIIELFRDGNVLLVDDQEKIIQPLTHVKYSTRSLKKGLEYCPPPEAFNPRKMKRKDLEKLLLNSEHDLIRTLAVRASFGSLYGSIACANANLNENIISNSMTDVQIDLLENSIKSMIDELGKENNTKIWMKDNETLEKWNRSKDVKEKEDLIPLIEEMAPVDVPYLDIRLSTDLETLSSGFDIIYGMHDAAAFLRREEEKLIQSGNDEGERRAKLDRRSEQQKSAIDKFLERAAVSQEIGKSIQDNWNHVNNILEQFNKATANENWQTIENKVSKIPWIGKINPSKRTIVAYLPDEKGEPATSVTLEVGKTVHQNAQRYFEESRVQKSKASGAKKALENTKKSKSKEEKRIAKDTASGKLKASKRSKKFWFEKYRWALLSNGSLLIGGKDARGNDTLVKKHLNPTDLYFHADLHGAPSCSLKLHDGLEIVKSTNEKAPEGVISLNISQNLNEEVSDARDMPEQIHQEAAQIAVCWSRAWGSGGSAATSFYARPSQVSKTTESGESLGRGSFVVRGKRNWHKDISLDLGIGIGLINGVPLPILGTPDTISKIFPRWGKIIPSKEKKEILANKISKATGLAQDDILSCLPPGGCTLEDHGIFINH